MALPYREPLWWENNDNVLALSQAMLRAGLIRNDIERSLFFQSPWRFWKEWDRMNRDLPLDCELEPSANPADNFMTTSEASRYLKLPWRTLRNWRALKTGPQFVKSGRVVVYRKQDLDAWAADNLRTNVCAS